ncbi:MAG: rubrerythrin, partial [Candidatus Omnitrophica bacterium]|nr:rubrerythrin [Candidatus Omnitrophota bacterium]
MNFSGSETVEIGIQIEKNGRDFYNIISENVADEKAKKLFSYLAKEEEKHIAAFKEILDSVIKYEPKQAYPQEYFAYMNALA